MVSPRDALEAVARAIASSGKLPDDMGVVLQEADSASDDSDIDLPTLEIQLMEADNVRLNNTDFVDYTVDENGNRTGRVYLSDYEMMVQIAIWTVKDGGYDPDELGEKLREALYPYSSYGPQEPLRDEDNAPIDDIIFFDIGLGERTDDLIQTPTVRRWTQEVELWAHEEFRTDEEYIISVDSPQDGDFASEDGDGTIDDIAGNNE